MTMSDDDSGQWIGLLIDAGILFGQTFFSVLVGVAAVTQEVGWAPALISAAIASGLKFFTFLASKRSINPEEY